MAFLSAEDARPAVAWAFVAPPAGVCLAWLLTRIAIHYSLWKAVPAFMLALALGAGICVWLAGRFAARQRGWWVVPRFLAWLVFSGAYVVGGLYLIDLLPISVGDGP
jgi:hypothetical protein